MKPAQRKRLKQKINESIYEVLAKHNERRKKRLSEWAAWNSRSSMTEIEWQALQMKAKANKTKPSN